MGEAWVVVSAPMHDPQQAVLVQPFEADHRRMEAEAVRRFDRLTLFDAKLRARAIVRRVAVRHDRVQAVDAAREFDDHQNAFRVLLDARALERLRREGGGGPAQYDGQRGTHANAIQTADEKFASRAAAANVRTGHV